MASIGSPPPTSPRLVGRYALVSRVVSGPFGDLWRARIASGPEQGRGVLVRLVERTAALDAPSIELVSNAGFAAMELRHSKIAALLDVTISDSEIVLVSEHVAGTVLHAVLRLTGPRRVPATPGIALRVAADVLAAVDEMRGPWAEIHPDPDTDDERVLARSIHGGLMPDGLLVATFGETMLLEAGLAGVATVLPAFVNDADVLSYRAPEQFDAKMPVDERADVFTVGILVWELIAGRSLFGPMFVPKPGGTGEKGLRRSDPLQASATRRKVASAPIPRLDALPLLRGKVTAEVATFVERCLERDVAKRYQSLSEALAALRALGSAVGTTEDVAKWVAGQGVPLDFPEAAPAPAPAASAPEALPPDVRRPADDAPNEDAATRPGVPARSRGLPVGATTTPMAAMSPLFIAEMAARANAAPPSPASSPETSKAAEVLPQASLESTPRVVPTESIPPGADLGAAAESIPPSADFGAAAESIPPGADLGAAAESIPPSAELGETAPLSPAAPATDSIAPPSVEPETLPPPARVATAESGTPPPRVAPADAEEPATLPPPPRAPAGVSLPAAVMPVVPAALPRSEGSADTSPGVAETSAPLARSIAAASADEGDVVDSPQSIARRRDSRKIVFGVLSAALLLLVLGAVSALFRRSGQDLPAAAQSSVPLPTTLASAAAPVVPSAARRTESVSARNPTLAPTAAGAGSPRSATPTGAPPTEKRATPRKRAYRPTGI